MPGRQVLSQETEELVHLAAGEDFSAIEQRWESACLEAPTSLDALNLVPAVEAISKLYKDDRVESMLWTGLGTLTERLGPVEALAVAVPVMLKWPKTEVLREQITELYRSAHAGRPGLETLLEEAGVAGGRPPRRALRTLELLLSLEVDNYLLTRDEAGAAQVVRIDPSDWQVTIRDKSGETTLGPVELADDYERAEADDYDVLRAFFPEQFAEMLDKDPPAAVECLLKSVGKPIDRDGLRDLLCPRHIPADQWKSWWTKARPRIKKSAHVRIEGKTPFTLRYDPIARSQAGEIGDAFDRVRSAPQRWAVLEPYLRKCAAGQSEPDPALLQRVGDYFREIAEDQTHRNAPGALTSWLQVREISIAAGDDQPDDGAVNLLASADSPGSYLHTVDVSSLWDSACACLAHARPDDAKAIFAEFLKTAPLEACDPVAQRLVELGFTEAEFDAVVQAILAEPMKCADALLWLWSGPASEQIRVTDRTGLLTRILRLLADLCRCDEMAAEDVRRIRVHARSVLAARKHAQFRECIEQMDAGIASTVRTQLKRVEGIGRAVKEDLRRILDRRYPPKVKPTVVLPWEREDVLFVTAAGLDKRQAEYAELVNVKMRENAIAIGDAAAHGDLSENSEYKFALEERDLLQARASQIQGELSIAQVLESSEVADTYISPGARVVFRHQQNGNRVTLTFLGPWEAKTEERVYNYKSPFAQSLMGLRVGQTAEMNVGDLSGTYVLVTVEPA